MKFISFVLLFGVCLIHAEEVSKKVDVPASASSVTKAQPQTIPEEVKQKVAAAPAHDIKSNSQEKKTESEHTESEPKSDAQKPESKSTDSSASTQTPEPEPTPYPAGHGSWNITDPKTNAPCILVSGTISLNATLKDHKGVNATRIISLGPTTPVNGSCSEKIIRWNLDSFNSSLQFKFVVNDTSKEVYLGRVDGEIYFKKHWSVGFNATIHAFETPLNKSYACSKLIEQPLVEEKERIITVALDDFKIQAAKVTKNKDFDESIDGCPTPSGGGPDVIPIVVGCALAILVVVVLVAYLINRRRSQAHGYLSM